MIQSLKNFYYWPIQCKECGYKTNSSIIALLHLKFKHKAHLSWSQIAWALRRGVELKILVTPIIILLFLILAICWPFWWVYEHLGRNIW